MLCLYRAHHPPTSTHYYESTSPSRGLRSASEQCLVVSSQRGTKSLSRTLSFTVPGWWNELLTPTIVPDNFQATPENLSLLSSLDFLKKKKNLKIKKINLHSLSLTLLSFPYPLTVWLEFALNNAWNVLLQALPVSVCLFIMYRLLYSSIVSCFG